MTHTILILGATSKTGGPLVRPLVAKGHKVRVLVHCADKGAELAEVVQKNFFFF
jgi:uncharacterized protein YbjT (DUF2867 family)